MKKFKVQFIGRLKGAIGITYFISTTVEGMDEEQARINLYDIYECVNFSKFTEIIKEGAEKYDND